MRLEGLRPSFMLDHHFTRRHLAEYLDGELEASARARLEHHADRCPSCRRMVQTLMRTLEGLRSLRARPPRSHSRGVSDSVILRLREEAMP